MPIRRFQLSPLVLNLTEQPRVLDRQHRLRRKGLKKIHNLRHKTASLTPVNRQSSHDFLIEKERHGQKRLITEPR